MILSYIQSPVVLTTYVPKIQLTVTLPSHSRSSKWARPKMFAHQHTLCSSYLPILSTYSTHRDVSQFANLSILNDLYKWQSLKSDPKYPERAVLTHSKLMFFSHTKRPWASWELSSWSNIINQSRTPAFGSEYFHHWNGLRNQNIFLTHAFSFLRFRFHDHNRTLISACINYDLTL
jgi:hypothetical protein